MDWRALSDIGQAFGTVSAVISAVALLGVARSLRLHRQQTVVSAHETARSLRMQLVLFAMQNPQYLPAWGFPVQQGHETAAEHAYLSLVFSHLEMSFRIGVLTELELHDGCDEMFKNQPNLDHWRRVRRFYLDDHDAHGNRFALIVDQHFKKADGTTPAVQEQHLRSVRRDYRWHPAAVSAIALTVLGAAIARNLRLRRKRQADGDFRP